jgi:hypothetical protein
LNYTSTEGGLDTRVCCPVHLGGLDVGAPSAAMSGALPGRRGDLGDPRLALFADHVLRHRQEIVNARHLGHPAAADRNTLARRPPRKIRHYLLRRRLTNPASPANSSREGEASTVRELQSRRCCQTAKRCRYKHALDRLNVGKVGQPGECEMLQDGAIQYPWPPVTSPLLLSCLGAAP